MVVYGVLVKNDLKAKTNFQNNSCQVVKAGFKMAKEINCVN